MLTPELKKYVEASLAAGVSTEHITQTLLRQGWDTLSINEALSQSSLPKQSRPRFFLPFIILVSVLILAGSGLLYLQSQQKFSANTTTSPEPTQKSGSTSGIFTLSTEKEEVMSGTFTLLADGSRIYAITKWTLTNPETNEKANLIEDLERVVIYPNGELFRENTSMKKFLRAFPAIPEATYGSSTYARTSYEGTHLMFDPILFKEGSKQAESGQQTTFNPLLVLEKNNPGYNYSERGMSQVRLFYSSTKAATLSTTQVSLPVMYFFTGEDPQPATLTFKASSQSNELSFPSAEELEESRIQEFTNILAASLITLEGQSAVYKNVDTNKIRSTLTTLASTPVSCDSQSMQQLTKTLYPDNSVQLPAQASSWKCSVRLGENGSSQIIYLDIINSATIKKTYRCTLNSCYQENS